MRNMRKNAIILALVLITLIISGCQESTEAKYNRAQKLLYPLKLEQCACTAYAVAEEKSIYSQKEQKGGFAIRGAVSYNQNGEQLVRYWLRSPSSYSASSYVEDTGYLANGYMDKRKKMYVRPALWIDLNADYFTSGEQ